MAITIQLLLCRCGASQQEVIERSAPNILIIVADDVSPTHLEVYGGEVPTPAINQLAEEGLTFRRAFSTASACTPSRFSLLTGLYPGRNRSEEFLLANPVRDSYNIQWDTPLKDQNLTLHEMLGEAGYFTGYVGKFHCGPLEFDNTALQERMGAFDTELDPLSEQGKTILQEHQKMITKAAKDLLGADFATNIMWENSSELPLNSLTEGHFLEWYTQGAMEFLEEAQQRQAPFFLMVSTTALHGPDHRRALQLDPTLTPAGGIQDPFKYHPPRSSVAERITKAGLKNNHFTAGAIYLDDQVGAIMEQLDQMGTSSNTLVIFTADHGTEPGKSTCYDKGVHVPFIVKWPNRILSGAVTEERVQLVDLFPTLGSIANNPQVDGLDGISIVPTFYGGQTERQFLYFEGGYQRAVSTDSFKYIATRFPHNRLELGELEFINHFNVPKQIHASIAARYHPGYFDADQLYDLTQDPYEQNNLAENPVYEERLKELQDLLASVLTTFDHPYELDNTDLFLTDEYASVVSNTKAIGTDYISWWRDDFLWPPAVPAGKEIQD